MITSRASREATTGAARAKIAANWQIGPARRGRVTTTETANRAGTFIEDRRRPGVEIGARCLGRRGAVRSKHLLEAGRCSLSGGSVCFRSVVARRKRQRRRSLKAYISSELALVDSSCFPRLGSAPLRLAGGLRFLASRPSITGSLLVCLPRSTSCPPLPVRLRGHTLEHFRTHFAVSVAATLPTRVPRYNWRSSFRIVGSSPRDNNILGTHMYIYIRAR